RNLGIVPAFAQRGDDAVRRFEPEIGADERIVDLIKRRGVEPALGDEIRNGAQRRGTAPEPAGETLPPLAPAFRGLGGRFAVGGTVLLTVLHPAPVIAVSA